MSNFITVIALFLTNTPHFYKVKPVRLYRRNHLIVLVRYFAHPAKLKILPEAEVEVFSNQWAFYPSDAPALPYWGFSWEVIP